MNSTVKVILGVIIVVLIIWGLATWLKSPVAPSTTAEPIKIGFIGPLTGDAANIGQNAKAAVEIAVSEVNAAGGINGRPLEVIYEDGKCNGKDAANAANKLINIDKTPIILGGACSSETSSFTGLAEQTKTAVLSYCSSAPTITAAGDYIFRDYPSDTFQGAFAANYIKNVLQKTKVGVLYVKSDWGSGIKDVFATEFKKLGGTVVAEEGYEQTARDLRTNLSKIKVANPDALYFLGYTEATIPGVKQAQELKISVPIFGGDAWDDSKIWTEVGAAGEGAMYSVVSAKPSSVFKDNMRSKINSDEIAVCTPTAYDGLKLLAQVLLKTGPDGTAIKNELYRTVYRGGVSADEIKFDQNGDLIGANYIVKKIINNVATEVK